MTSAGSDTPAWLIKGLTRRVWEMSNSRTERWKAYSGAVHCCDQRQPLLANNSGMHLERGLEPDQIEPKVNWRGPSLVPVQFTVLTLLKTDKSSSLCAKLLSFMKNVHKRQNCNNIVLHKITNFRWDYHTGQSTLQFLWRSKHRSNIKTMTNCMPSFFDREITGPQADWKLQLSEQTRHCQVRLVTSSVKLIITITAIILRTMLKKLSS